MGAALLRTLDYWREWHHDRLEFLASLRIVRDELRENASSIHMHRVMHQTPDSEFRDEAYIATRLLLARHLPPDLRTELARWYHAMFRHVAATRRPHGETPPMDTEDERQLSASVGQRLLDDLSALDAALVEVARSRGSHDEPSYGPSFGGWQRRDPDTSLTPYEAAHGTRGSDPTDRSAFLAAHRAELLMVEKERSGSITVRWSTWAKLRRAIHRGAHRVETLLRRRR